MFIVAYRDAEFPGEMIPKVQKAAYMTSILVTYRCQILKSWMSNVITNDDHDSPDRTIKNAD